MTLTWEPANDHPGDQNADSRRLAAGATSAYYSLGEDTNQLGDYAGWGVELIQIQHGDELELAGVHLGHYHTEDGAKAAAELHELHEWASDDDQD